MTKRITLTIGLLIVVLTAAWYFDLFHDPVETIDELIGHNLDYAAKEYFESNPDDYVTFSINQELNEFQGGVLTNRDRFRDSIIHQYTWTYLNHRVTIWAVKTDNFPEEIVDAIRYKNGVEF
jgi:hypothetical protein